MAATLVPGFIGGHLLTPSATTSLAADAALSRSLDGSPASAITIGFSYRNHANRYCRVFRDDRAAGQVAGVACRKDGNWWLLVLATTAPRSSSEYRTAAANLPPAVAATVDATINGAPLDALSEAAAASHGWR